MDLIYFDRPAPVTERPWTN